MPYISRLYSSRLDDRWVTMSGAKVLLGDDGEVKGGLGGKYTGQNVSAVGSKKVNITPREMSSMVAPMVAGEKQAFDAANKKLSDRQTNISRDRANLERYKAEREGNDQFDQKAVRESISRQQSEIERGEKTLARFENAQRKAQASYDTARERARQSLSTRYNVTPVAPVDTPIQRQRAR